MSDVLNHREAPINENQWTGLSEAVTQVARRQLIGRRFLSVYGPLGGGVQTVEVDRTPSWDLALISLAGDRADEVAAERRYQRVPALCKDFVLDWRDWEEAQTTGRDIDWSKAQAAASFVALAEDHLIFHGLPEVQIDGLLTVEGRHVLPSVGWDNPGSGFDDVARAVSHLTAAGFMPPFVVVAGVMIYAAWHRLYGNTGVLEIEQVAKLVGGGVYQSPLVGNDTVLVLAPGPENLDLAVGLDFNVAFVESTSMNHIFRVLETLSLRIKRTGAICQIWQDA